MSDQVEIVAAEDAPSDTDSVDAVASASAAGEEPEAATVKAASKNKSVAKAADSEAVEPVVTEQDELLVDGPVGEVLDDGSDDIVEPKAEIAVEPEATLPQVTEPVSIEPQAVEAVATVDDEPLVDGPVGEVLDDGSDDIVEPKAEVAVEPQATVPEATEPVATESLAVKAVASEEDELLVDGPVGEVLDDGSDDIVEPMAEAEVEATAMGEESVDDSSEDDGSVTDADDGKGTVRILAVGQQVNGTVKRIADFGAFIDIGVGRDGLIHISELSVRRVGKVTDVLAEGQEVTAWIKKLDRDRNRISLTLIDPNTKTIRDLNKDDLVQGTVTRILPYGAFVDIGIGRDALLHVREMGVGYVAKPEDVVKVGDSIESRIIELSRRRGRVDLSLKGLRDEPEPTPAPQAQRSESQPSNNSRRRQAEPEPEPVVEDDFEELEVLSPMELAFKRAMEAEGMEMPVNPKNQGKRNRRERNRSMQDEIVSRTLTTGRK